MLTSFVKTPRNMQISNCALLTLTAAWLLATVSAHTSLFKPQSREGGQETMSDSFNEFGCMKPGPGPITKVTAGDEIPVSYYRNNHVGGFIRWAIIKSGEAETKENFDNNVFYYTCRECGVNCGPRNGQPYSLWEAAWDGVDVFIIECGDKIRIPDYLDDGDYVLQFTHFATGHSNQKAGLATPTYRSCADLKVSGGSSSNPKPACPTFVGGDRGTWFEKKPSDQCAYFYSNEIPNFVFEETDESKIGEHYKFGKPADYERCIAANPPAPEPTPAPEPAPAPTPESAPESIVPAVVPAVSRAAIAPSQIATLLAALLNSPDSDSAPAPGSVAPSPA